MDNVDLNKLRNDLMEYFGIGMFSVSGFAIMDLIEVESANDEKLIEIAIKNGFDLSDYKRDKSLRLHI